MKFLGKLLLLLGALFLGAICSAVAATITVPGTSHLWLAGMPNGTSGGFGDAAPGQSPVLVTGVTFVAGDHLGFAAIGAVANGPAITQVGPDGSTLSSFRLGAFNGIADLGAPLNSLVGVFLGVLQPDALPAPAHLNWGAQSSGNYSILSPLLKQPFFIGDGLDSSSFPQEIIVPAGATRLYLGTLDGFEWNNNTGSFDVDVSNLGAFSIIPEPATSLLMGSALVVLGVHRSRRRRQNRA